MATARDVARLAGVSTSTVSHVLNGTRAVSEGVRQRVLAACEELSFEPNVVARSLKTSQSRTVGFLVNDVNVFFTDILRGVEEVAEQHGYSVIFCHSHGDAERELSYLRLLRGRQVDGIILAPTGTRHPALERLAANQYPVVLVDGAVPGLGFDLVSVDNETAAYAAVKHLTDLGHSRIAMVSGAAGFISTESRLQGYRRALVDSGAGFDPSLVVSGHSRTREGREAVLSLMSRTPRPSALFVGNHQMTVGAIIALRELGIAVPDDLALVGFDDLDWAAFLRPPLTTIAQPTYEIGRSAMKLLLDRIGRSADGPARRVLLAGQLMVRESSGPLATAAGEHASPSDRSEGPLPAQPSAGRRLAAAPRSRARQ
jgi:LacI family transcriptional regulator